MSRPLYFLFSHVYLCIDSIFNGWNIQRVNSKQNHHFYGIRLHHLCNFDSAKISVNYLINSSTTLNEKVHHFFNCCIDKVTLKCINSTTDKYTWLSFKNYIPFSYRYLLSRTQNQILGNSILQLNLAKTCKFDLFHQVNKLKHKK